MIGIGDMGTQGEPSHRRTKQPAACTSNKTTSHEQAGCLERQLRRVAYDLHDGPVQTLSAALLEMRSRTRPSAETHDNRSLTEARRLVEAALDEIRELTVAYRPACLDEQCLTAMVDGFLDVARGRHEEIRIQRIAEGVPGDRRFSDSARIALFRIVQEAVTNALVHARASEVTVRIEFDDHELRCSITDDGCGFALTPDYFESPHCHGLVGMRDRADLLGGHFEITSVPGTGTTVQAGIRL